MRRFTVTVVAASLSVSLSATAVADIITPTEVQVTTQFGLGVIVAESMINGSGLSGEGAVRDQLHSNVDADGWFSGCEDGAIAGGLAPDCAENIFASGPVNEQVAEFIFEDTFEVVEALVWNYNEFNAGVGPIPGRGVKTFEMLVSPSLTDAFTSLGNFDLAAANPGDEAGLFTEAAQALSTADLDGTRDVRRVRFQLLEGHAGPADYVGLSEVRFYGTPSTTFVRGDCNADGDVDMADGITLLDIAFLGTATSPCRAACDFDGSGAFDVTTAVRLFTFLYSGGPPPAAPFPECGSMTDGDRALGCETLPQACN